MRRLEITWSKRAIDRLKDIYQYYKPKSLQGAKNVRKDILDKAKKIIFINQYQIDEINPKYRRIIVRDYKILYKSDGNKIEIVDIVNAKRSPLYIKNL